VQLGLLRSADRELLKLVQTVARPEFDVVGSIVTVLGSSEVTAGIAAGLFVARVRARRPDWWVPLAIALIVIVESVLKIVIAQPVPPVDVQRDLGLFRGLSPSFAHSFPSGHVGRDTFLLIVAHGWPRVAVALALALIAVSRVYTGQHWPSDVLGGLLLGAAVAWAARAISRGPSID
jgi:membrane-associated phospholipid phosphatase